MMDRRTFLIAVASLLAGSRIEASEEVVFDTFLRSLEVDIGLGKKASTLSDDVLIKESLRFFTTNCLSANTSEDDIRECIGSRVADDFAKGRVIQLDGWWLSYSEAALLGIAYSKDYLQSRATADVSYEDAKIGELAKIIKWGPQGTVYGRGYNIQPDGHSAFWVVLEKLLPGAIVVLNGRILKTKVHGDVLTTAQYEKDGLAEILFSPGLYDVELFHPKKGLRQFVGQFKVGKKPPYLIKEDGTKSEVFCPVANWGPQYTNAGIAFNQQPSGGSAFWIKTQCSPDQVIVRLGEHELITSRWNELITASISDSVIWASPGAVPISLFDPGSGELYPFGVFEIRP